MGNVNTGSWICLSQCRIEKIWTTKKKSESLFLMVRSFNFWLTFSIELVPTNPDWGLSACPRKTHLRFARFAFTWNLSHESKLETITINHRHLREENKICLQIIISQTQTIKKFLSMEKYWSTDTLKKIYFNWNISYRIVSLNKIFQFTCINTTLTL